MSPMAQVYEKNRRLSNEGTSDDSSSDSEAEEESKSDNRGDAIIDEDSSEESEEEPEQVLASELEVQPMDLQEFDLDLTRFNTDEG